MLLPSTILSGKMPKEPTWPDDGDIFLFSWRVCIHRRMLRLVGINMNDLEELCMFLNGIEGPTFVTAAMSESSTVNTDATDLLDEHGHFFNQRMVSMLLRTGSTR